jgi:hypothetical protein
MKRFFYAGLTSLMTVALFPADASSEDWSFVLTPYVWVPAIDTSLSVGTNPPAEDSGSILDYLDGAFLINGEARRGAWSNLGEFNYLDFSDDFGSTPIGSVAEWRIEGVMASLGAAYAFYDHSDVRIEALAGLRGWGVDTTTRVVRQQASVSSTWIDPIIGLRFSAPLSEQEGSSPGPPFFNFATTRGSEGRMPSVWDLNLRLVYDLSKPLHTKVRPRLIVDVFHVASQATAVTFDQVRTFGPGADTNPNPAFGLATRYQPPTAMRLGFELDF